MSLVIGIIVTLCGIAVAVLMAAIAALSVAVLRGTALEILTVGGATFGACLTLELAAAGLYAALRGRP
ncbi:hypothetical protein [Actinoplanes sp. NPDC049118]|uniref:hypothetical protein n=1 Tax=Actinoplanes sp. NPDC049118 TaxID=3155769 RepID=UPI0033DAABD7